MDQNTHLKCIKNGRVFMYTKILADRADMIPCDSTGAIAQGHIGDAVANEATLTRRKTKFLGNPTNGVLYTYTDILSQRSDFISIDTEEQWEQIQAVGKGDGHGVTAPVLRRSERQEEVPEWDERDLIRAENCGLSPVMGRPEKSVLENVLHEDIDAEIGPSVDKITIQNPPEINIRPLDTGSGEVPDVSGIAKREAVNHLADWAKKHHGEKIDRRQQLPAVIEMCEVLASEAKSAAE